MRALSTALFLSLFLLACSPRTESRFATVADVDPARAAFSPGPGEENPCAAYTSYIPDTNRLEEWPVRVIRLNFHFTNNSDSSANMSEAEGVRFARSLLEDARKKVAENVKLFLPIGNDLPVLPVRIDYQLTGRPNDPDDDGIYFHYDDELYYYIHKGRERNLFDRRVINKYGVQLDTVLNIFIMPPPTDAVKAGANAGGVGVFLGNAIKIAGLGDPPNKGFWKFAPVLNHEVGHMLGLSHAWTGRDGCDDTPKHPNCWNFEVGNGCDSLTSNNLMDYNAYQRAWSPCQIGRVQQTMANENSRARRFLVPSWCRLDPQKTIFIRDTVNWSGAKDLEGHLIIEPGAQLTVHCRVSLPAAARVVIRPGGALVLQGGRLHNACGQQWEGIVLESRGEERGRLRLSGDSRLENMTYPLPSPGGN